jgi:hypothetical protein
MENQNEMFPLSDEQIYNMALEEWVGVLASMWVLCGRPVDVERLKIYKRNLSRVPLGLLEMAIDRVFRENVYQNVPVTGVIWDAIKKELGNPYNLDMAMENWTPPARPKKIIEFMDAE